MANFYRDNEDLLYYVEKGIDWAPLVRVTEKGFRDEDGFRTADEAVAFYRELMDGVGQFSAEAIAPVAGRLDHAGVHLGRDGEVVHPQEFRDIFDRIRSMDLHGLCVPRELGGSNAPMIVYFINSEVMGRADVSVMAHHGFHGGMAMASLIFSVSEGTTEVDPVTGRFTRTRFRQTIDEIVAGDAWGAMDITEPDAGSDMARLRTRAEQDASGRWFITGEKIFITSGHAKWHYVIARTEGPDSGLEGLSMFLVKTYEDRPDGSRERFVTLSRVEEKMGHSASATCGLIFERAPAELIGKRGEGFKYMLMLMNNARLGVGFECLGMCEAAFRKARDYAATRPSMGKTIDKHEMIADYLEGMQTDVQAIRAMAMDACWHEEMATKLSLLAGQMPSLSAEERARYEQDARRYKARARKLTPLLKYFAAEKAVEMSRMAVQIHGGNGYITEFGVEKLLRDAVVMPIYEGTSQIQSLMAMKDSLGAIVKNPQGIVTEIARAEWRAMSARDDLERRVAAIEALALRAQQHLVLRTAGDKLKGLRNQPFGSWKDELTKNWDPKRDFAYAMLHAERLTKLLTDAVICEVLLVQAKKHEERRDVLERYLERCEIRDKALFEEITTRGDRLLAKLERSPRAAAAE